MATETAAGVGVTPRLDAHLLKFSQAWTALLSGLGFILSQTVAGRWLVVAVAVCLTISALVPAIGPYRLLYRFVVVPLKLIMPRIVEDDPAPHRFAQGVGAVFTVASSLVLFFVPGGAVAGWTLDLIVFALSLINFTVGFCAGCFVYYQLGRIGLMPRVRYAGGFHWRGV
jgi:hypothetical protein